MKKKQDSQFNNLSGGAPDVPKKKQTHKPSSFEQKLLNSLIEDALSQQVSTNKARKVKEEAAQAVIAVLSEFLSSYIIIGYDFDGTPIRVVCAKTGRDSDALAQALQRYIMTSHFNNDSNLQ